MLPTMRLNHRDRETERAAAVAAWAILKILENFDKAREERFGE